MKKHRRLILWLSILVFIIAYIIVCIFFMEIPPFNIILPLGLLVILIIILVAFIASIIWVSKENVPILEKNKIYENDNCMFFFDLMFGTCYQIIRKDGTLFFVKIGNGLFTIKEKNIFKGEQGFEEYIRAKKVKIVPINEIRNIQILEGKHPLDLMPTYHYDRYVSFQSNPFSKNLQSVYNASAAQIYNFLSGYQTAEKDIFF